MRDGAISKLSTGVLKMKFMSRTKEKEEKRGQAEQAEALFASQLPENLKGKKFFVEASYMPIENLKFGRFSYRGFNKEIERLLRGKTAKEGGSNAQIKEDVTKKEMASFHENLGKKFDKKQQGAHFGSRNSEPRQPQHRDDRAPRGAWRQRGSGQYRGSGIAEGSDNVRGSSRGGFRSDQGYQRGSWSQRGSENPRGGWAPRGQDHYRGSRNSRGFNQNRGTWRGGSTRGGGGSRGFRGFRQPSYD